MASSLARPGWSLVSALDINLFFQWEHFLVRNKAPESLDFPSLFLSFPFFPSLFLVFASNSLGKINKIQALVNIYVFLTQKSECMSFHWFLTGLGNRVHIFQMNFHSNQHSRIKKLLIFSGCLNILVSKFVGFLRFSRALEGLVRSGRLVGKNSSYFVEFRLHGVELWPKPPKPLFCCLVVLLCRFGWSWWWFWCSWGWF